MFETIIIAILFISTLAFLYFWQEKRDKAEKERFREFVMANKSNNIEQYANVIPEDTKPLNVAMPDVLEDLQDADPEILIRVLNDKKDENI